VCVSNPLLIQLRGSTPTQEVPTELSALCQPISASLAPSSVPPLAPTIAETKKTILVPVTSALAFWLKLSYLQPPEHQKPKELRFRACIPFRVRRCSRLGLKTHGYWGPVLVLVPGRSGPELLAGATRCYQKRPHCAELELAFWSGSGRAFGTAIRVNGFLNF
jgi:hypothetical protein